MSRVWYTKVVGVTRKNRDGSDRQEIVASCCAGEPLILHREPNNPHDPCAIAVLRESGHQLGYIAADVAAGMCDQLDAGSPIRARVSDITGGDGDYAFGCNVEITMPS